jgi:hypothetical protein
MSQRNAVVCQAGAVERTKMSTFSVLFFERLAFDILDFGTIALHPHFKAVMFVISRIRIIQIVAN